MFNSLHNYIFIHLCKFLNVSDKNMLKLVCKYTYNILKNDYTFTFQQEHINSELYKAKMSVRGGNSVINIFRYKDCGITISVLSYLTSMLYAGYKCIVAVNCSYEEEWKVTRDKYPNLAPCFIYYSKYSREDFKQLMEKYIMIMSVESLNIFFYSINFDKTIVIYDNVSPSCYGYNSISILLETYYKLPLTANLLTNYKLIYNNNNNNNNNNTIMAHRLTRRVDYNNNNTIMAHRIDSNNNNNSELSNKPVKIFKIEANNVRVRLPPVYSKNLHAIDPNGKYNISKAEETELPPVPPKPLSKMSAVEGDSLIPAIYIKHTYIYFGKTSKDPGDKGIKNLATKLEKIYKKYKKVLVVWKRLHRAIMTTKNIYKLLFLLSFKGYEALYVNAENINKASKLEKGIVIISFDKFFQIYNRKIFVEPSVVVYMSQHSPSLSYEQEYKILNQISLNTKFIYIQPIFMSDESINKETTTLILYLYKYNLPINVIKHIANEVKHLIPAVVLPRRIIYTISILLKALNNKSFIDEEIEKIEKLSLCRFSSYWVKVACYINYKCMNFCPCRTEDYYYGASKEYYYYILESYSIKNLKNIYNKYNIIYPKRTEEYTQKQYKEILLDQLDDFIYILKKNY